MSLKLTTQDLHQDWEQLPNGTYKRRKRPRNDSDASGGTFTPPPAQKRRIRQSQKPLLNQLESEWLGMLRCKYPPSLNIHAQSWRVKIAGGAWFKVDFCAFIDNRWVAWEVKGNKGKNIDRGLLALKVAASQYPEIEWNLVWKEDGDWKTQTLIP